MAQLVADRSLAGTPVAAVSLGGAMLGGIPEHEAHAILQLAAERGVRLVELGHVAVYVHAAGRHIATRRLVEARCAESAAGLTLGRGLGVQLLLFRRVRG